MTNRDFLKQVSTDGLPDAATVLDRAQKPRSVWRRVAVAVVAAVAIGAVVTVGAQVHMNELEQIEAQSGKGPITDLTQLETGKLYTIENHFKLKDGSSWEFEYNYDVYNELPEGTNPRELPYPENAAGEFSEDDEHRRFCVYCRSFVWTPTDPVEYSYQSSSANEPETHHLRTLVCAECGYLLEVFDADGEDVPRKLSNEITIANLAERKPTPPKIDGLTIYDDPAELEQGVAYGVIWERGEYYFFESTPENHEKATHRFCCGHCDGLNFYIDGPFVKTFTDESGDTVTYECYTMSCASCGDALIDFIPDD